MSESQVTVLVVDDHTVARQGLRAILALDARIHIVGEACNGQEAIQQVEALQPQVVLMDVLMPVMDGLEATRSIKASHPKTNVIIITSVNDDFQAVEAIRCGASGYLLKDTPIDLLGSSIWTVGQGGILVDADLLRRAVGAMPQMGRPYGGSGGSTPALETLTRREMRVVQLIAEGRTNKEIGAELCLAEVTIKKHVQCIVTKLGASDRTSAAVLAVRLGLVG